MKQWQVGITQAPGWFAAIALVCILVGVAALASAWWLARRRARRERERRDALQDALTGLGNRAQFQKRLEAARDGRAPDGQGGGILGLLFIDIDNFTYVNDLLGHDAGDRALAQIAHRLKDWPGAMGDLFRLGGDEFVYLLEDVHSPSELKQACERVLARIQEPVHVDGRRFDMTASIGVALARRSAADSLLRDADLAMYEAKSSGKNTYRFFSEGTRSALVRRLDVTQGLKHALEHDEFFLVFQPKVDLPSHRVAGLEALIRWNRPGVGGVAPAEFLPVAEQSGLIGPLGDWVLQQSLRQLAKWRDEGVPLVPVAINLAASQFTSGSLPRKIADALERHRLSARLLEVEITETALMGDRAVASESLIALEAMGVHVAMDDFGTGQSSLSLLQELPVGSLKLDRTFVVRALAPPPTLSQAPRTGALRGPHGPAAQRARSTAVLSAVIGLGRALDIKTVAEGVETAEQLAFLCGHGCSQAQGYLLARPMMARDVARFLREAAERADEPGRHSTRCPAAGVCGRHGEACGVTAPAGTPEASPARSRAASDAALDATSTDS